MGLYDFFYYLFGVFFGIDRYTACPYLYDALLILSTVFTVIAVKLVLDLPLVLVHNWKQKLKGDQ